MSRETCIYYIGASTRCRAHQPNCAYHKDGQCQAAGKLETRAAVPDYGIRIGRWSREKVEKQ